MVITPNFLLYIAQILYCGIHSPSQFKSQQPFYKSISFLKILSFLQTCKLNSSGAKELPCLFHFFLYLYAFALVQSALSSLTMVEESYLSQDLAYYDHLHEAFPDSSAVISSLFSSSIFCPCLSYCTYYTTFN